MEREEQKDCVLKAGDQKERKVEEETEIEYSIHMLNSQLFGSLF